MTDERDKRNERDAKAFFDAIARRYDRVYAISGSSSRERLARVLAEIEGKQRVLVLGLGTGRELPALLDRGHQVTGLDVSPKMIALCNTRSRTVPTVEADFWQPLPFADASFDAVLALHGTLAHPPETDSPSRLAAEVKRVLSSDGVLVAELPAKAALPHLAAAEHAAGVNIEITSATSFVHRDDVAGVSLAGIALDEEGWASAFAPSLRARLSPLGVAEYFLVATPA
ncbi:Phosphatidylethanolamine N-methyltransferase [Labilithrix luteola]|uniref:Phosphatidylethanolamine N-methyltransferase n=1 Tax=Labilithrix luteola TaxID=1391654 RepID=A0A0K1PYG3_9BACT|nr:class I SAM-dependent methyltransferase [Labilithrix luteola]AKU98568.1 Phosphatidylethanolamine N-methyltransferase [Labilithrix luteola]